MLRKVLPLILLVVAAASAYADKVSGFASGTPSGKTFILGAKGGPYTVDTSKATIRFKGKFFALAKLTGGSQVTVEGTKTGKSIMATKVDIGMLRGAAKPVTGAAKPGAKPAVVKTKPMVTKPPVVKTKPMGSKPAVVKAKPMVTKPAVGKTKPMGTKPV